MVLCCRAQGVQGGINGREMKKGCPLDDLQPHGADIPTINAVKPRLLDSTACLPATATATDHHYLPPLS